ncbi:eCIS core domain-containing protein [Nakamurella sp. GG22]
MRSHDHESDEATLRPRSARIDAHPPAHVLRAAAAGRSDVLDGAALLNLQRSVGNSGVGALLNEEERSPVHDVITSGGSPLAPEVRDEMQGRLGHDFSDVRVHNDSRAHESAHSVNAHAYTVGSNVVFQRDKYDPSSAAGKTMLAHELTHVVQQRSGPVDGTAAQGGIKVSDPSDRFEQEAAANAEQVMSGPAPAAPVTAGVAGAAAVQREEVPEEEEEPVQGSFVQREAAPEEEQDELEG